MDISRLRRKTGKTVDDVVEETGLSKEYLVALEEGRRKLLDREAQILSSIYKKTTDEMQNDSWSRDSDNLVNAIKKYGCFNSIELYDEDQLKIFVNMINDMWFYFSQIFYDKRLFLYRDNMQHEEHLMSFVNYESLKRLIKRSAYEYGSSRGFPFTIYGFESPSVCWVELYDAEETADSINTVVMEDICGTSITNNTLEYIDNLSQQILIPKGWNSKRSRIKFLERRFEHGKCTYAEWKIGRNEVKFCNGELCLKKSNKPEGRIYRRMMRARELPVPFKKGEYFCRSEESNPYCPVKDNRLPTDKEKCTYCKGITQAWQAREWLLERLSDEEIRSIHSICVLEEKHPEIYNEFLRLYGNNSFHEAELVYDRSYTFGSYSLNNCIHASKYGYVNGMHRTKIAQLLDIVVPVNWETYDKIENCELIE